MLTLARQRVIFTAAAAAPSFAARVLPGVLTSTFVEHGSGSALAQSTNYAVVAHYSMTSRVSRSTRKLIAEFDANGYLPVIVSAADCPDALDWSGDLPSRAIVVRKPNVGHDFGSWATGLALFPELADGHSVILANDSMLGPFRPLAPLISRFHAADADVWGLTNSRQYTPHIQSYFLGFKDGVLQRPFMTRFWRGVRNEPSKRRIVFRGELGLSRTLRNNGCKLTAAFASSEIVAPGRNPVIDGWDRLLGEGFPFVKRALVNPNEPVRDQVAHEVQRRLGIQVDDWA